MHEQRKIHLELKASEGEKKAKSRAEQLHFSIEFSQDNPVYCEFINHSLHSVSLHCASLSVVANSMAMQRLVLSLIYIFQFKKESLL